MLYDHIVPGIFLSRPNRFIAHCLINGKEEICHVKNTGRCKELLMPGRTVYLQHVPSCARKTQYDVIAVDKNGVLFNIDSQAPNRAVAEWLPSFLGDRAVIRPEYCYGHSRIDFYATLGPQEILMEVKGVTLEQNGIALFPDAPTSRGTRHLQELAAAAQSGVTCYAMFVVQAAGCVQFTPNQKTDPAFANALKQAQAAGVNLLAYSCHVTPNSMVIAHPMPIILE